MESIEDEQWVKHATHEMSDGVATCKQDKAKVSSLLGRRAHKNLVVECTKFITKWSTLLQDKEQPLNRNS